MKKAFDPKYPTVTGKNEINFIGAAEQYFDEINKGNLDDTKDSYIDDYNTRIFPLIEYSKPMYDYSEEYIITLIDKIKDHWHYSKGSISGTISHEIVNVWEKYFEDYGSDGKPLWGSIRKYSEDKNDVAGAELSIIPRSLTIPENIEMNKLLLNPMCPDGRKSGLVVMAYTGVRNNEACGLYFRDFIEMTINPGNYYIRIHETTEINSSKHKLSGKTYNSPRVLPVLDALATYLIKRMDFISTNISFPLVNKYGEVFNSVLDMPIASKKDDLSIGCSSYDLSVAGREFLREEMQFKESRVSGICYSMSKEEDERFKEKDPTTYLLRRNFATWLYILGLTEKECFYYIGHKLDSNTKKRSDFVDEELLMRIKKKLDSHIANSTI